MLSHACIKWYNDIGRIAWLLEYHTMIYGHYVIVYIASLIGINPANPSKYSPVFIWNAKVVIIVDVLTRRGNKSLNTDPECRLISAMNL